MDNATNGLAGSNFSRIPRELRDMIYSEVTNGSPAPTYIVSSDFTKPTLQQSPAASLLNICNSIRDEVAPTVLQAVTLEVHADCIVPAEALSSLLTDLANRRHVRHIHVVCLVFTPRSGKSGEDQIDPSLWNTSRASLPGLDRLVLCPQERWSQKPDPPIWVEYFLYGWNDRLIVRFFSISLNEWLEQIGIDGQEGIPDWVEIDCALWTKHLHSAAASVKIEEVARETWKKFRRGTGNAKSKRLREA